MVEDKTSQNIKLSDGEKITINGKEYIVNNDNLIPKEQQKQNEPSFKLVFKKYGGFGISKDLDKSELKDVKIYEDNKTYAIDIYPLLEKICGKDRVNGVIKDFSGCVFELPDTLGERKISFGDKDLFRMEQELESLIDSVFTNSKQAVSFKTLINKTLNDPFIDFAHLLW